MTLVPDNREAVLAALGFNPRDPKVQALALVAERYGLDLILKQVFLIQGTVYVSHAGLLSVAHRSGDLDGIEVEVVEDEKKWTATAKIYRKSMSRPFTYTDECLKNEKVQSPRKRAITRAERNALRRAFDVGVDVWEDDRTGDASVTLSDSRPELPGKTHSVPSQGQPEEGGPQPPGLEGSRVPVTEPSSSGPFMDPGPSLPPGQSVVVRAREMGLDDAERHALVWWVTRDRPEPTGSTKNLTAKEAGSCHAALFHLRKYGEKLWDTSSQKMSDSPSQPSTENPATTDTSSSESPDGDGAGSAEPSSS